MGLCCVRAVTICQLQSKCSLGTFDALEAKALSYIVQILVLEILGTEIATFHALTMTQLHFGASLTPRIRT